MDFEALWLIATLIFVFSGTIKGLVGIGLPTAVIALMSQFTDPRQAIALMLLPLLITNAFQVWRAGMIVSAFRRYWPFSITLILGIFIFTHFAASFSENVLKIITGFVIVIFALVSAFARPLSIPEKHDRKAQLLIGSLAGIMGGLTSLWAPPMVVYLMSRRLPKDEFVGALGFLLLAGSLPLLAGYWQTGLTSPKILLYSLLMTIPALIGVMIGEQGRRYLSGDQFRQLFLFVFFLLGLNLIRSAIFT